MRREKPVHGSLRERGDGQRGIHQADCPGYEGTVDDPQVVVAPDSAVSVGRGTHDDAAEPVIGSRGTESERARRHVGSVKGEAETALGAFVETLDEGDAPAVEIVAVGGVG